MPNDATRWTEMLRTVVNGLLSNPTIQYEKVNLVMDLAVQYADRMMFEREVRMKEVKDAKH